MKGTLHLWAAITTVHHILFYKSHSITGAELMSFRWLSAYETHLSMLKSVASRDIAIVSQNLFLKFHENTEAQNQRHPPTHSIPMNCDKTHISGTIRIGHTCQKQSRMMKRNLNLWQYFSQRQRELLLPKVGTFHAWNLKQKPSTPYNDFETQREIISETLSETTNFR